MSALHQIADMCSAQGDVRFVPKADVEPFSQLRDQQRFDVPDLALSILP